MEDFWRSSAFELAAGYARREFTPSEVGDAVLARVGRLNGKLNAMVAMDEDAVRRDFEKSTARINGGRRLGPMDGVPVVIKDNLNVRGLPTSWGCRVLDGEIQQRDELPVARLRAQGAIIVGKTNVPEFALRGFTNNAVFGATRNPWDTALTPGGSSGGTASAVAAGFAPIGLGADAGGSIRRPAGFTNLIGLKPSSGRVPRRNTLPPLTADYEVVGPMARTVADAALAYQMIARPDLVDPSSYAFSRWTPVPDLERDPPRQRILLVERFRDLPVDTEVADSVRGSASNLERLGHVVETGPAPFDTTAFNRSFGTISQVGLAHAVGTRNWRGKMSDEFEHSIEQGLALSAVAYLEALEIARRLREEIAGCYKKIDLILTPSSGTLPWPAEERAPKTVNSQPADSGAHSVFTGFANISGYPAINIPAAPSASGLPIGFQLVGRYGDDDLLLSMAAQYERAHPWAYRWPPLPGSGRSTAT